MNKAIIKLIAFALMIASCATQGSTKSAEAASQSQPQSGADYSVEWHEDYPNREFDVTFVSKADRRICLSDGHWPHTPEPGGWPYRRGSMAVGPGRVYVVANGQKYPIKDSVRGVCDPGDRADFDLACSIVVEPGASIGASIPFDEFEGDLPTERNVERTLVLDISPRFCVAGK